MNIKEMNDFDWTSDIKAGETLGNIKQNNFRGYNVGDKITVTGGIYIEDYDGDRDGWIWLSNEPFMINDIIPNLGRFVLLALNEKLINNPENKHFLLNDWNELYIGDYHQDNDLLISRYIENLKEDNDFDWINDIDDSKPQKGTAWAITGIKNETDSIQCQKFLFNLGFGWVNDAKEIIYTPAKQFGSIFRGDIKHKLFGLSSKQGIDSTIEIAKGESRQDKLYHFEWVNGETKLKDIIYLTDNINESNDFDWVEDVKYTLGQLVDLGDLSVGDKLILRGNVFNNKTHQRTYVDNFEVEIVSKSKYREGLDGYGMSFSPERGDVVDAMGGVINTEDISFLKQDRDLEVVQHIKSNDRLNEDNDFGWAGNVSSEPDFDIWEKVTNIIDNEVSQGPNYDSWVGSNSYNELDNILSRYEIDIDDMGDFFTFPPKNKNGVEINHYQIQEILDDLLFNGYDDPNDDYMLESYNPFDFGWAGGEVHLKPEYVIGRRICYRKQKNNISSYNLFKYNRYELKLNDVREVDCWVIDHIDGDNVVIEMEDTGEDMDFRYDRVEQLLNLGVWAIMNDDGSIENDFVNPNIKESIKYINNVVKELSILSEDGKTEPDMEWDLSDNIKKDLDRSKKWVKTGEDVKEYVKVLMDKIKSLPKATKKKIIGYALLGMVSVNTINNYISDVEKEKPTDTEIIRSNIKKPAIRKPSYELKQFIKSEEKLRLTAYEIGDDMVTIGYGHAEPTTKTKMIPGKTKITKEKAEKLFEKDIEEASNGLNRILDSWVDQGIDVEITQGMYDAMTSMIFNMGIGNFRMSDFIQMVKRGNYQQAQDTIKTTNVTYPGHKPRREKESEMFGGYYNI